MNLRHKLEQEMNNSAHMNNVINDIYNNEIQKIKDDVSTVNQQMAKIKGIRSLVRDIEEDINVIEPIAEDSNNTSDRASDDYREEDMQTPKKEL
jgi:predicted phage tail protein